MEWEEDDYGDYNSSTETAISDNDSDYGYSCEEAINNDDHRIPDKNYTVLKETDIRNLQEAEISHVSAVLSLSIVESIVLLRNYKWDVTRLLDEWFADEGKVRETVGLLNFRPVGAVIDLETSDCGICFESYSLASMLSAGCGHQFCTDCWRGYVSTAICDGPGCLMLRCPEPSCKSAIGEDLINWVTSKIDQEKYNRFSVRSYIEDKKNLKWCPGADCEYAVKFDDLSVEVKDVTCLCSNTFCWDCLEECHRPVDCSTVAKWVLKNSTESENVSWIIAYTKPCPKCHRPIEKNLGCNHMTCRPPCMFQFCWYCLEPWKDHRDYSCNRYRSRKQEDESERKRVRKYLERYTHYFERWNANRKAEEKALQDLQQMQNVNLQKLGCSQNQTAGQLEFIVEAWRQIIECRRVLKWTYAYGYYLPEDENSKRDLFEYLQGQAEIGLERLHSCAEKDLSIFLGDSNLKDHDETEDFTQFRSKLAGLTSVTKKYFENLVRALENGLSDVDSKAGCSRSRAQN